MIRYIRLLGKVGFYLLGMFPKVLWYAYRKDHIPFEKRYALARRIIRKVVWACSVDFHIEGLDQVDFTQNNVFCPNHQSFFDAMLLDIFPVPLLIVAKIETMGYPYVSQVAKMIEILLLDRSDLRQNLRLLKQIEASLMEPNRHFLIFLEGTRTKHEDRRVNEFKPGGLRAAFTTKSTIVPMAICGTWKPLNPKINQKRYRVDVHFLKPIPYEEYSKYSTAELANLLHTLVSNRVKALMVHQQ